jgi:eukaryotic-like serine/threonine-protein kinase
MEVQYQGQKQVYTYEIREMEMDNTPSFGRLLKEYRKTSDLTQEQLAEKVGYSIETIKKIEAGKLRPGKPLAEQLADVLRVAPEDHEAFIKIARQEIQPRVRDQPKQPIDLTVKKRKLRLWHALSSTGQSDHLRASADRNRIHMLAKVNIFWIKGVLENSLHGAAAITLGMEYRSQAVLNPWDRIVPQPDSPACALPPETRITEIFDDLNGELLILGAPGAGKTTLLLDLARDLIARSEDDAQHPIPVVFNLSAWAEQCLPLAVWLVEEMSMRYDVPRKVGRAWVETDQILPLLDGLDEVLLERREACVDAINLFRQDHGLVSLVVCSRVDDYELLTTRLKLQGAILVQPLTSEQIDIYLASAGDQLAALRMVLAEDMVLLDMARLPLMINIMSLAYHGVAVNTLPTGSTVEERRAYLFAAYVDRVLQRRSSIPYFSQGQTIRWLSWLASSMRQNTQTIFFIERMQPTWLRAHAQRQHYAFGVGLIIGLITGFAWGVAWGVVNGLMFGLSYGLLFGLVNGATNGFTIGLVVGLAVSKDTTAVAPHEAISKSIKYMLRVGLIIGAASGFVTGLMLELVYGLPHGLPLGLAVGIVGGLSSGVTVGLVAHPDKIEIVETIRWLWSQAKANVARKLVFGLVTGLVIGSVLGLANGLAWGVTYGLAYGLASGLATSLATGLIMILAAGLTTGEFEEKTVPNQGIWRSARNTIYASLAFGSASGLVFGVIYGIINSLFELKYGFVGGLVGGLSHGAVVGILGGLVYGGLACVQHMVLRSIFYLDDFIPWSYTHFLDYATERVLLRKVGGGYIYMHRLLLEYFAKLYDEGGTRNEANNRPAPIGNTTA